MDAKQTGALIAQRRKALGLTQKQLAERLLISDKAVSKWENGASYPEITLLPPLAELLGLTVDELLAGEAKEEGAPPGETDAPPGTADIPPDKTAPQAYLADRLGSVDDRLLLGTAVLLLAAGYCARPFVWLTGIRDLVVVVVAYVVLRVWHGKQRGRFAALGVDTAVSRCRARLTDRVFVLVGLLSACLIAWILVAGAFSEKELTKIQRYHIQLDWINNTWSTLPQYLIVLLLLFLVLVGLFALAFRRLTPETRFRPLAVTLPVLPAILGAAVIGWQRVQTALAVMPWARDELEEQIAAAGQRAQTGAAIAVAVLALVLLVLWRVTHGRVPLISAAALAGYAAIWLPSGALWLEIGTQMLYEWYSIENITIQLGGLLLLLVLSALCAGVALFADSLRRKKKG